jgi:hypothetical protein
MEISPSAIADAATNALVRRFFIDGLPMPRLLAKVKG